VVISGLANEYVQYFTTPEEFERQHYEGGSTLFGEFSSNLIRDELARLTFRLTRGRVAPDPYPFDPTNGVIASSSPYSSGAGSATPVRQPEQTRRLERAAFSWRGAPNGFDRPLDSPFVRVQRRAGGRWRPVTNDLGLQILWSVDSDGVYEARWEIPLDARRGTYRFVITANRYRIASARFTVLAATSLNVQASPGSGSARLRLAYPAAVPEKDIAFRPPFAKGGRVVAKVNGRREVARSKRRSFTLRGPAGASVEIAAGAARDRFGNRNGEAFTFTL
jgi:neutral ceramidase